MLKGVIWTGLSDFMPDCLPIMESAEPANVKMFSDATCWDAGIDDNHQYNTFHTSGLFASKIKAKLCHGTSNMG